MLCLLHVRYRVILWSRDADARVALLGASQALFEASMYTFVFLWTPALSPAGEKLPHGFIFAIFMTASMVGTALAGRLVRSMPLELLMQVRAGIVELAITDKDLESDAGSATGSAHSPCLSMSTARSCFVKTALCRPTIAFTRQ